MKNVRLFFNLNEKTKKAGRKYNFSLLAEVSALVFLGVSEHPMNLARWFILGIVVITSLIAFLANE